jgi:hypothetical protein
LRLRRDTIAVNAGFEHYWMPSWHTSLYSAWDRVRYDPTANAMLCEIAGFGNGLGGSLTAGIAGCNMNWRQWGVGSHTQWDVTKTFYLGVEVLYSDLQSAKIGCATVVAGGRPGGNTVSFGNAGLLESDASDWAVRVRAHRDFLP